MLARLWSEANDGTEYKDVYKVQEDPRQLKTPCFSSGGGAHFRGRNWLPGGGGEMQAQPGRRRGPATAVTRTLL